MIRGRWYGVRGRRFVRPALILHGPGAPERRVLAELEDKPWAAEDGESWRAAFRLDSGLGEADALELSVTPDIVVTLQPTPGPQRARTVQRPPLTRARTRPMTQGPESPDAKPEVDAPPCDPTETPGAGADLDSPRDRSDPLRPAGGRPARPAAAAGRALEPQRLAVRLTNAEGALERERERRVEAELALERQRTESRELSAELGRISAELALARAAEREARTTADLLDVSRRDHHALQVRYDALCAEHERTLRAQERLRAELGARTDELAGGREALTDGRETLSGGPGAVKGRSHRDSMPASHGDRVPVPGAEPSAAPVMAAGPSPHTDRPLNPSLRSHGWTARLLAVLVLAAAVFAVYLILHSTVLH